ncbi:MAG: hypothetical protein P8O23_08450 [Opitutales bacterium]|nr:hypothetical protein [Opitutales bacterium]
MSNQDIANLWWISFIIAFSYNLLCDSGFFAASTLIMVITNTANIALGFWGMYRLKRSVLFSEIKRTARHKSAMSR